MSHAEDPTGERCYCWTRLERMNLCKYHHRGTNGWIICFDSLLRGKKVFKDVLADPVGRGGFSCIVAVDAEPK